MSWEYTHTVCDKVLYLETGTVVKTSDISAIKVSGAYKDQRFVSLEMVGGQTLNAHRAWFKNQESAVQFAKSLAAKIWNFGEKK